MGNSDAGLSQRERLLKWLDSGSEDVRDMLSHLPNEERRAFLYTNRTVPLNARFDPNRIPASPFPDRQMTQLLRSAREIIRAWRKERKSSRRCPCGHLFIFWVLHTSVRGPLVGKRRTYKLYCRSCRAPCG